MNPLAENYLRKHSVYPPQLFEKPGPEVGMIIVVPCFNEPDLISSLESLWHCDRPACFTEVIAVINAPENSGLEIISQNEKTFSETQKWIEIHQDKTVRFFLIKSYSLPEKHAGVGLARKIGMDEAVSRFSSILKTGSELKDKIIACFDADSTCDKNYLVEIEKHFRENPGTPASSVYFEHSLDTPVKGFELFSGAINSGIVQYELFLRYYRQALKYAGHPSAFHTIGSAMAVRADVYCKQGGMNKKKAGEDFYFLQKIIPLGNFTEINSTRVIPSPRPSSRVPFGTGRAISEFIEKNEKEMLVYHPQTFEDLKILVGLIPRFYEMPLDSEPLETCPASLKQFLSENNFEEQLREIKENSSSEKMFIKRFFRWLDGFLVLKFTHFARDYFYEKIPVAEAASRLLRMKNSKEENLCLPAEKLLDVYRGLDRYNCLETLHAPFEEHRGNL